jgi:uncharacterized protein (TIGR02145 family)
VWRQGLLEATQDESFTSGQAPEIPDPVLAPAVTWQDTIEVFTDLEALARQAVQAVPRAPDPKAAIRSIGWDLEGEGTIDTACATSPCLLELPVPQLAAGEVLLGSVVVEDELDRVFRFPTRVRLASLLQFTDPRDGQQYGFRQIGSQTWMSENLNYGLKVPPTGNQNRADTVEKFCYGDAEAGCTARGGLYEWAEALNLPWDCNNLDTTVDSCAVTPVHQGICPEGWHVPTLEEWRELATFVETMSGCTHCAGEQLKATHGWVGATPGLNSFGFAAIPSGYSFDGGFVDTSTVAKFWSATQLDPYAAWSLLLDDGNIDITEEYADKYLQGLPLRCAKNP